MNNFYRIIIVCILSSLTLSCRSYNTQTLPSLPGSPEQVRQLLRAADNGDAQKIREMLKAGVDINQIDHGWGTALHQAAFSGDKNALKTLVECGADVNKLDEDGHTPLHNATEVESEHALEIVKILVSHGANVNAKVKSNRVPDGWIDISEGSTPLHNAASLTLFNDDFEPHGDIAVVELLLSHGAKVNVEDGFGCRPLDYALIAQSLDVMKVLIEHGADINAKNSKDGSTVLHSAVNYGDLEVVKFLISHGADIHAKDFDGETPLHKAALYRDKDIVDYLIQQGADLLAPSRRNETPHDFLSEPNETDPTILSLSEEKVYSLIVTNGLNIRTKLNAESIDYDTLWFPSKTYIKGFSSSLQRWIKEDVPKIKNVYIDSDYILKNFDKYNREYAGFIKDGIKYIICNMIIATKETSQLPIQNSFSGGIYDGGCVQVVLFFEAQTKQVIWFRCNNQ